MSHVPDPPEARAPHPPVSAAGMDLRSTTGRMRRDRVFSIICICATTVAIAVLTVLLVSIVTTGAPRFSWSFITSLASKEAEKAGILPALMGTLFTCLICALSAVPLGVGTAILLEEFKPRDRILARLHGLIQTNITNLAGVPSIVYGILGVTAFANVFGLFGVAGQSDLTIGQKWYLQYTGEDQAAYLVPVDPATGRELFALNDPDALPTCENASEFLRIMPGDRLVSFQPEMINREQSDAIRAQVKEQSKPFGDELEDGITATRSGSRNNGPANIPDLETAGNILDPALEVAGLSEAMADDRDRLIADLIALNQLNRKPLRDGRRAIVADFEAMVYTNSGARNKLLVDSKPVVIERKSWYYLALPFGRGILAGGLTLMLVILPVVIVATQEALRAVPDSMRQGALALGSTRLQAVSKIALPSAIPGICTGTILAMSRAIGEAAPLLIVTGVVFISFTPEHLLDRFTVMPLQIYSWIGKPDQDFRAVAAAGIILLLIVLLSFNAIAVLIRQKTQKRY